MTVSAAAASNAEIQARQAAAQAAAASKANNSSTSGSAFAAVANAGDTLPGVAASGGSTLSSGMLSALLGINNGSGSSGAQAPAGAAGTEHHHHGLGQLVENLTSIAASMAVAAAV